MLTTEVLLLTTVPIYFRKKIYKRLKKVLNQEKPAFYLDKQKEAVFAAISQQSLLIIILLTRGEKTLTFMLSAILQELKVTIIVAPFNTLKKDYIWRLRLSYIKHII
jgi:superfamily II DNA helicase RecQ